MDLTKSTTMAAMPIKANESTAYHGIGLARLLASRPAMLCILDLSADGDAE